MFSNKSFLLISFSTVDEYNQFLVLSDNVLSRFKSSNVICTGLYDVSNDKQLNFAKELLANGFIEATDENIERYFKSFFIKNYSIDSVQYMDSDFKMIDSKDILDNKQDEFDYTEDEFVGYGCNLEIGNKETKTL